MAQTRPDIPEDVKREVRQRCRFGCVFCGLPVYDYDHIVDWAETGLHDPDQLTLLCPTHHSEKTRGLRTRDQVAAANEAPFNRERGITAPYGLHFGGDALATMRIGTDTFQSTGHLFPFVIDNWPVLCFLRGEDGLRLQLDLVDEFNRPRLIIRDNELMMRADAWDISFEGQRLTIRDGLGRVFLRILFEPPSSITIERARFLHNGAWVEVLPSMLKIANGARMNGNRWAGELGFTIGWCPEFYQPLSLLRFDTPRFGAEVLESLRAPQSDEDSGELDMLDEETLAPLDLS